MTYEALACKRFYVILIKKYWFLMSHWFFIFGILIMDGSRGSVEILANSTISNRCETKEAGPFSSNYT